MGRTIKPPKRHVNEGAQPLKRAIQKLLADPLAQKLLAGEFREGDHIVVDADVEGILTFTKQEQPEPVTV